MKLTSTYLSEEKRDLSDWQNLDQAFVIFIDGNHKLKSSGTNNQVPSANAKNAANAAGGAPVGVTTNAPARSAPTINAPVLNVPASTEPKVTRGQMHS